MSRSLERHLSRTLALAIVAAGLVAGVASFGFAYMEAQEFQDDTLRQVAALVAPKGLDGKGRAGIGPGAPNRQANDAEARVVVFRLPADTGAASAQWLPVDLKPGFHTVDSREGRWRVLMRPTMRGERVAVAQATEVRDDMAIDSALRTLAPLSVLLPLLVWLTVRIVRKELAPVRRLAQSLDAQPAARPAAVPDLDLPDEIAPFVRAINRLLARVARLMDEQRRFVADAAHELRSPLTALSVQAENLENAATLEAMRQRVSPLREGIDRARRLTEQLLSLARTQAASAARTQIDVSKMARELIADYQPLAEARTIDLGMEEAGKLVLTAEAEILRGVLRNALDNALRHTPAQGQVTLRLHSEGADAVIEVVDSGPGIPTAERGRVFEPFHRIEGVGGEGSGLGLTIARDAAARLGGAVSLHDRAEGNGLVFRYRQPLAP